MNQNIKKKPAGLLVAESVRERTCSYTKRTLLLLQGFFLF